MSEPLATILEGLGLLLAYVIITLVNHRSLSNKVDTIAVANDTQNKAQTKIQQDAMAAQANSFSQAVTALTSSFQASLSFRDGQDKFQKDTLTNLQERFTALEQQSQRDHKQIDDLCIAVEARDKQLETLQQSLDAKNIELIKANEIITQQAEQLTQLNDLQKRVTALEEQVKAMTTEREELIRQRDEALAANAKLTEALAAKTEALAEAQAELATLKARPSAPSSATPSSCPTDQALKPSEDAKTQ